MKQKEIKTTSNQDIERQLIPRLQIMGCILIAFSLCALIYAIFSKTVPTPIDDEYKTPEEMQQFSGTPDLTDSSPLSLTKPEKINFFIVSLIFAVIGLSCVLIAYQKSKRSL